jgi:hypothetical protein
MSSPRKSRSRGPNPTKPLGLLPNSEAATDAASKPAQPTERQQQRRIGRRWWKTKRSMGGSRDFQKLLNCFASESCIFLVTPKCRLTHPSQHLQPRSEWRLLANLKIFNGPGVTSAQRARSSIEFTSVWLSLNSQSTLLRWSTCTIGVWQPSTNKLHAQHATLPGITR